MAHRFHFLIDSTVEALCSASHLQLSRNALLDLNPFILKEFDIVLIDVLSSIVSHPFTNGHFVLHFDHGNKLFGCCFGITLLFQKGYPWVGGVIVKEGCVIFVFVVWLHCKLLEIRMNLLKQTCGACRILRKRGRMHLYIKWIPMPGI